MIQLLLIGTTHLNMPDNGDVLMPEASDILSPTRQQELDDFVAQCSCFKPTTVCLEVATTDQHSLSQRYQSYVADPRTATEDEREQIGFRLAKLCDLSFVQAVDWNETIDGDSLGDVMDTHPVEMEAIIATQRVLMHSVETAFRLRSITDFYAYINQREVTDVMHQAYTDIAAIGPTGSRWVESYWNERNQRIYENVRRAAKTGDRIVLLYGLAHVHLLRKFFETDDDFLVRTLNAILT
ncbi:hypothetical protein EVJ27_07585 [Exiguobacterium sp. SH3S2]|uniref:DUF5694 domain-containing protein n=1 Tax=unclassified Exiguobacterium TaxID=2644629 RepID=UPI00103E4641|nr:MULTISPECIES: DUF5694 domain-containing protein [unclassified Exiguobacterium]TCI26195.1 hypothetical protein EVJ32_07105 [Exiguobacterium sp. SH5S4]TCI45722.1 hypothetical protein EVJ28_07585 [Exiguobacterium sp. SH3S3]TCI60122.1 hypothetical protein EVJ26_11665 [Exiguobacterium sp. SH3S1]TCI60931.1 hypothetical protein EVJ27_07585 [Exiguobacterium sp. SH3S2]